jgi:hypothetical protein
MPRARVVAVIEEAVLVEVLDIVGSSLASFRPKANAASSIVRQSWFSGVPATRLTQARRRPNSSVWSLRSSQLGKLPVFLTSEGSWLPIISPMPRNVMTIQSAVCDDSV